MKQILAIPQVTTVQRNALVSPENGTMIFNTDLLATQITVDGGVTWQTQGADYPKQTVYVSNDGLDVVGNGTQGLPYASLSFALSQITDATPTKPYEIIVSTGNYTDANIALKPSIYIDLSQSSLTITTSLTLDASWLGVNGNCSLENGKGCSFPATITLDFTAVGAGFAVLSLQNNVSSTASTWNILGAPGGSVFIAGMNFGFGTEWSYNIQKCYGGVFSGAVGNISVTDCPSFSLTDLFHTGTTLMTSTSTMTMLHRNSTCGGAVTYQQTSAGVTSIIARANAYLAGAVTLDNGVGGGSITLDADTLEVLPTLVNGASYVPTSISDAMQANNYFSPANYVPTAGAPGTWVANSPTGNLKGIDNALVTLGLLNVQDFTANGTYTPTVGCNKYLAMLTGGGGGGGGSGTAGGPGGTGGAGGTTTLGALASAGGGSGGINGATNPGGGGNTAGAGSGTVIYPGSFGNNGTGIDNTSTGGNGGTSYLGGCGRGGAAGAANGGVIPPNNSGGGGGGASGTTGGVSPAGGGCSGTTVMFFNTTVTSQSVTIGNGGTPGSAGTGGAPGTIGAKGRLTIYEYK